MQASWLAAVARQSVGVSVFHYAPSATWWPPSAKEITRSVRARDRIALGARPSDIFRLVILQGFRLVCLGVVVGTAAAFIFSQLAKSILFGVSTTDPASIGIAVLVLGSAGILACLVPSWRAAHFNPASLLRE